MQIYEYKDCVIYPTPRYVGGTREWKTEVMIKYHNEIRKYGTDKRFSTEAEAVFNSIQFGKQLIDQGMVLLGMAV